MTIGRRESRPVEALLRHRKVLGQVLWVCSLAAIMYATLLPSYQTLSSTRWCVVCGSLGGVDVVLNLVMFVPLGIGFALAGMRPVRALPTMFLLTLTIETLQFALIRGRDASIGDLLMNTAGGAIGFGLGASIEAWLTPSRRVAMRLTLLWLGVWIIMQSVAAYSLVPETTSSRYYGQIKRALGGNPAYPGDVPLATIDGQPIPNTSYDKAGLPAPALSSPEGALVRVDVIPRGVIRRPVAIVRIADGSLEEVLRVGQHGTSLVFGIRTGAATLRLRPIYFAIRDVFPRSDPGTRHDTIHIEGRHTAREVWLQADTDGAHYEATMTVSPAMGWRLFLPFRAYAHREIRDRMLDMLWLVLLLAPVGYWHWCSTRGEPADGGSHRTRSRVFVLAGVLVGLVGVPVSFGLDLPAAVEWGGVAFGLLVGAVAARLTLRG